MNQRAFLVVNTDGKICEFSSKMIAHVQLMRRRIKIALKKKIRLPQAKLVGASSFQENTSAAIQAVAAGFTPDVLVGGDVVRRFVSEASVQGKTVAKGKVKSKMAQLVHSLGVHVAPLYNM